MSASRVCIGVEGHLMGGEGVWDAEEAPLLCETMSSGRENAPIDGNDF